MHRSIMRPFAILAGVVSFVALQSASAATFNNSYLDGASWNTVFAQGFSPAELPNPDLSLSFTDNVSLGPSQCEPVPVNTGLQGMTEKWLVNQPGKCTPKGGDPTGTPIPSEKTSWTFCCVAPGFSP